MTEDSVNESYASGGNGLKLYYRTTGNSDKPPLLFVHGWSQTHAVWHKQVNSSLSNTHHLVTFDLRGHGYSERLVGEEYYRDSQLYADDIHGIITRCCQKKPVLVGWSSGSLYIADYLRHYGADNISGILFSGGLHGLGLEGQADMLGTEPGRYMADTMSKDLQTQYQAMCHCSADMIANSNTNDLNLLTAQSMMTPPDVRLATMARITDNSHILAQLDCPVSIIQGRQDPFVLVKAAEHLKNLIPNSTYSLYENSAHMPFWEEPERFNRELTYFANDVFSNN